MPESTRVSKQKHSKKEKQYLFCERKEEEKIKRKEKKIERERLFIHSQ